MLSAGAIRRRFSQQATEDQRRSLAQSIAQADELRDTMATPGWKLVEAFLESYRERSYSEFKRGERDADLYRADITVLDFIANSLSAMVRMGARARLELEKPPVSRKPAA